MFNYYLLSASKREREVTECVCEDVQKYVADKNNVFSDFEEKVSSFFKKIDNINAATAIGTIEFLDKIAKLNTIKNSCQV